MRIFIAIFLMLALNCFGQGLPAIYMTQPYVGNGLLQSTDNVSAQQSIGIFTNQLVNTNQFFTSNTVQAANTTAGTNAVVSLVNTNGINATNAITGGTNAVAALVNTNSINLTNYVNFQSTNNGAFDSNNVNQKFLISTNYANTNANYLVTNATANLVPNNVGIATNLGIFDGIGGFVAYQNVIGVGHVYEGTAPFYGSFIDDGSTRSSIPFSAITGFPAATVNAENVYTNALIGTNRIANNYSNVIVLGGAGRSQANTITSTTFKWNPNLVMWSNTITGDCITNNSGVYVEQSSIGIGEYNGTIGGTWSIVSGASPAPNSSGWGSFEDLNTSGRVLTNISGSWINGNVPIGDLPPATLSTNSITATNDAFGNPFTNSYVRTSLGNSTNEYLRTPISTNQILVQAVFMPTNNSTGVGLIGGVVNTAVITNDTPNGFSGYKVGQGIIIASSGQQLTISTINNPSNATCVELLTSSPSKSAYTVYSDAAYFTDVNGNTAGAVANDGSQLIWGRVGSNSGRLIMASDKAGGTWNWQLNSSANMTLNNNASTSSGGILTLNTNAPYESFDIFAAGWAAFRAITNSGVSGLGFLPMLGDYVIGNSSATRSGNGLTVQSNIYCGQIVTSTNGFASTSNSVSAVTVGASPFLFTNTTTANLNCFVSGGAATVSIALNGTTIAGSLAGLDYPIWGLPPNSYITVTYTVGTPTMNTNRW